MSLPRHSVLLVLFLNRFNFFLATIHFKSLFRICHVADTKLSIHKSSVTLQLRSVSVPKTPGKPQRPFVALATELEDSTWKRKLRVGKREGILSSERNTNFETTRKKFSTFLSPVAFMSPSILNKTRKRSLKLKGCLKEWLEKTNFEKLENVKPRRKIKRGQGIKMT